MVGREVPVTVWSREKVKAAIVGSTGYGGVELIRLLQAHPLVEITSVVSFSSSGQLLTEGFPHLTNVLNRVLDEVDVPLLASKADVVFLATPSGVSAKLVPSFVDAGMRVIDLSGDFRLITQELYREWYNKEPAPADYLSRTVYGLTEVFGEEVKGASFISNPGCYPTAAALGLVPAVQEGWIEPSSLIIDAKTGISGAGRGLGLQVHYAEANENFSAYKVNRHQHIPEIEQTLSRVLGQGVTVTFTTHLVPMTRGIMATMYGTLLGDKSDQDFIDLYQSYYEGRPFIRIRPQGKWPATKEVSGSNYCDIGFSVDRRTGRVTIISVIDNVVKGVAGQAIQNLNVSMGWDETTGLLFAPIYP